MKITNEQIEYFLNAHRIFQTPSHFPTPERTIEEYKSIYGEELENKKAPYYRTLSKTCLSCVRFCVMTVIGDLQRMGLINNKGELVSE